MVGRPVNPPSDGWSLTVPPTSWRKLTAHLYDDLGEEHGAVILAGHAGGPRGPRLLARDLLFASDGVDYVPGSRGHRALTATFVRDAALRARDEGLAYLAVHNHGGSDRVAFSTTDLASHERGYPALRDLTGRQVIGGVVLARSAAAGDLWLPDGRRAELAELVIPGNNLLRLRPQPAPAPNGSNPTLDRQTRLYGDRGQEVLGQMRVAVVGLGGVGSILTELLARLGVGHLVLVDPELTDPTNVPRLIAARRMDALGWLRGRQQPLLLQELGRRLAAPKARLAARNARRANRTVRVTVIRRDVAHPQAMTALTSCDWIFLAADSHLARHQVNAVVHQYLIPVTQAGVKIPTQKDGTIGQIHAVMRLVQPGLGCLWCNGLIDSSELAIETAPEPQRHLARYVNDVPAPSVITLNALAAAEAANHFMLAVTQLHDDDHDVAAVIHRPRTRDRDLQVPRQDSDCRWCTKTGRLAIGDALELPVIPR